MANTATINNQIGLPPELVPLLMNSYVCEYASIKKDGTPITSPLIPFPGKDGKTIDINTGLTYPGKAERARNNPKVCLLYSEPKGIPGSNPPAILVYGRAAVRDADLQGNTDRYAKSIRERASLFRKAPVFMLKWMVGYLARIWIEITPVKILWWAEGDMTRKAKQWEAAMGMPMPVSDPHPEPLVRAHPPLSAPPADWCTDLDYALENLGKPILTVVDEDGYPVPFRTAGGKSVPRGAHLDLIPATPVKAKGRACLTFHTIQVKNDEMYSNENVSFIGDVDDDEGGVSFQVERQLVCASFKRGLTDMLSTGMLMMRMKDRLKIEAARRGQPVPVVRLD